MQVDIMVPFWGPVRYLEELVHSVLAQSAAGWRLTVVDDAYPDDSARRFVESLNDERVRYVRNPENLGISRSFQRCVDLAESEIVVIPGMDDRFMPDYVRVITETFSRVPLADVVQPRVRVIGPEGESRVTLADRVKARMMPRAEGDTLMSGDRLAASLMRGDWLYWPSLAFRRTAIAKRQFDENLAVIQDLALIVEMVLDGAVLAVVQDVVFEYRRHDESASSLGLVDGSRFEGESAYFETAASLFRRHGWKRAERASRMRITSRLHALSVMPQAARTRDLRSVGVLARHALGR